MPLLLDIGLPLLVVFVMTVVGLELTFADFTRVLRYPGLVAVSLIVQWIILPLVAALIIRVLVLPDTLAGGIIVVAAAPIAAISNYYSLIAGANLALSVTLTAVSCFLAAMMTPMIGSLMFGQLLGTAAGFDLPVGKAVWLTFVGLLLPIMAGMSIRKLAPAWVASRSRLLQWLSFMAVIALLGFVVVDQFAMISLQIGLLVSAALLFTFGTLLAGWLVGKIVAKNSEDRAAVLFGYPARNLAFATLIAANAVGRVDIASFAAIFFIVQCVVLLSISLLLRARYPRIHSAQLQ